MGRVLVTRPLTEGGTDPLVQAGHEIVIPPKPLTAPELVALAPEFDGIVSHLTDRVDAAVLDAGKAGKLRVVANAAVGYDNIDVGRAHEMGITVCNTPGVLDDTTADLAFLLILAATRLSSEAERDLREGRWKGWGFGDHLARDVHGVTLGLVGFGRIGRAVAQRAVGFDMEVIHTARHDTGLHGYVPTLERIAPALGHREPARTADRVDPTSHRRGGTGRHETDSGPRQHGSRAGGGRECVGRRP